MRSDNICGLKTENDWHSSLRFFMCMFGLIAMKAAFILSNIKKHCFKKKTKNILRESYSIWCFLYVLQQKLATCGLWCACSFLGAGIMSPPTTPESQHPTTLQNVLNNFKTSQLKTKTFGKNILAIRGYKRPFTLKICFWC